jgi:hypothetical protein
MSRRVSYAEEQKIQTGVLGEIYRGIPITEDTRISHWVRSRDGARPIKSLQDMLKKNYLDNGVRAVLFGVHEGLSNIRFAIFVQPSFLEQE